MRGLLRKFWDWLTQDEGMTWEKYHRNMERRKRK